MFLIDDDYGFANFYVLKQSQFQAEAEALSGSDEVAQKVNELKTKVDVLVLALATTLLPNRDEAVTANPIDGLALVLAIKDYISQGDAQLTELREGLKPGSLNDYMIHVITQTDQATTSLAVLEHMSTNDVFGFANFYATNRAEYEAKASETIDDPTNIDDLLNDINALFDPSATQATTTPASTTLSTPASATSSEHLRRLHTRAAKPAGSKNSLSVQGAACWVSSHVAAS